MSKIKLLFFFLFFCLLFLNSACNASEVKSSDLIENARKYEGKNIDYKGEVIGDVMSRGEYSWINVHDGKNALGVWIKSELASVILRTGSYKSKGDIIQVNGVFHRACPEHGGDPDIHANSLEKIVPGNPVLEKIDNKKINGIILLTLILSGIWISTKLKHK